MHKSKCPVCGSSHTVKNGKRKGLIIDGKQGLFGVFNDYKIQMCQFHMKQIIRRHLPYLFTCQMAACEGIPNTNSKIEGTFTDLKKNLNNHSGMTEENRKRFINGFFLALIKLLA